MTPDALELGVGAVVTVVAGGGATLMARWLKRSIVRSIHDAVTEIAARPIKEMGDSLGASIDELRESNAREHEVTAERLAALEDRQAGVESRMASVEKCLGRQEESS